MNPDHGAGVDLLGSGSASEPAGGLTMSGAVRRGAFYLDVSLDVAPGEVLGVLGPNGAGKTTLLRTLAGLESLAAGTIRLGDLTLDDGDGIFVPPENRPVGLVFQDYRLFPHLDVRDNVAFGPRSRGTGRRRARATADSWLERLDLTALAGRRPDEISGGQAQRVALARALAANPDLLLLDEPLAALDARTRLDVRAQLRGHLKDFAGPVLMITHDPLEALVMADRLLVLEHGRVVQEGAPAEVARRPATQYVARLVGLNLFPASLDPVSGLVALDGGGTFSAVHDELGPEDEDGEPARNAPAESGPSGRRVLVGLRPSAITLHAAPPVRTSSRNVWPGTVAGLELLADRIRVQVDATPPALVDISAASVAELALRPGSNVWLSAKATETEAYPDPAYA